MSGTLGKKAAGAAIRRERFTYVSASLMFAAALAAAATVPSNAAEGTPPPPVRVLTVAEGLSNNWIKGLFLDGETLWISAGSERSGGIACYDTKNGTLAPFRGPKGFEARTLHGVARFRGKLYLGTEKGVYEISGGKAALKEREGRLVLSHARLAADGDRHLYALARTLYGGLFRFDGTKWEDVLLPAGEGTFNNGTDILVLGPGDLLVSTTDRGIWRLKDGAWKEYGKKEGLPGIWVTALTLAGKRVFAGSYNGLAEFDGTAWSDRSAIVGGRRVSAVKAVAGWLAAGTFENGVYLKGEGGAPSLYGSGQGLSDDRVIALEGSAADGLLFVGTVNGLNIVSLSGSK